MTHPVPPESPEPTQYEAPKLEELGTLHGSTQVEDNTGSVTTTV